MERVDNIIEHTDNLKRGSCGPCHNCYFRGCRCNGCTVARRNRARHLNRPDSGWDNPNVSATEARKHLRELEQMGMGTYLVAKECGLNLTTVSKIAHGHHKIIRKQTEAKILSVTFSSKWMGNPIPAQRKLLQLGLAGVTIRAISQKTGLKEQLLADMRNGARQRVQRANYNKISGLTPNDFPEFKRRAIADCRKIIKRDGIDVNT